MIEGVLSENPLALWIDGQEPQSLDVRRHGAETVSGGSEDELLAVGVERKIQEPLLRPVVYTNDEIVVEVL